MDGEQVVQTPAAEVPAEPSFDMDAAVESIAEGMGFEEEKEMPEDTTPKAEAGSEEEKSVTETKPTAETKPAVEGAVVTPAAPATDAPDTWTKEAKAEWAKVPATVQAEIRRREDDIARYVGETKPVAEIGQGFEQMIAPYQAAFKQYGVNPWNHLSNLMRFHATLMWGDPQQKAAVAIGLLKDAGLDPTKIGQDGNFAAAFQQQPNRQVQALEARIRQLEGGVTGVVSDLTAQRTAEREAEVEKFAKDPAHPYFYDVWQDIAGFMEKGICKTLGEAYDKAVWANPVTRQKEVERIAAAKAEATATAAANKARSSRRSAAVNVSGTGVGGGAAKTNENWETTMADTLAEIRAR